MNGGSAFRTLDQWLVWLSTLSPNEIELGLDRVQRVLKRLDLARPGLVIHVAGTNGKGSCVMMIETFLRRRGLNVGAYTSPHLQKYNERVRVGGRDCSDEDLIGAFHRVEAARKDESLTYFEYGTLAALCVFEQRRTDAIVLEIGMGGRLDAVNAIDPDAGIITNIGLDHCEWLGHDIETIGREKAGIFRAGKPFVFGSGKIPQSILQCATEAGATLLVAGRDFRAIRTESLDGTWEWRGRSVQLRDLSRPSLRAAVQIENAAAVLALLESLGFDELLQRDTVDQVLGSLFIPGRMQVVNAGREWLLDVAHNADSAVVLAGSLVQCYPGRCVIAVIGMLGDKDAAAIVGPLSAAVTTWIAVTAESARAKPAQELAAIIAEVSGKPCLIAESVAAGLQAAEDRARDSDITMVCGSFYVVGPALDALYSRTPVLPLSPIGDS